MFMMLFQLAAQKLKQGQFLSPDDDKSEEDRDVWG